MRNTWNLRAVLRSSVLLISADHEVKIESGVEHDVSIHLEAMAICQGHMDI